MSFKISIVTVSLNQGHYIEEAIQSVIKQRYNNFEHIIIDGLSSDNTINILKKYKHLKWISEKDDGQSDALNKGFLRCTGDVIGWLNADDVYLENTFNAVIEEFEKTTCDAVYGNFMFFNKDNQITKQVNVIEPSKFLAKFICFIPSTTFFFKKKIINHNILLDKDLFICMDKDFFANLFSKNYRINKINKYLAKFRWHDSNKSLDTFKIKKIRYREGLIIFNRYSSIKIPYNLFGLFMYIFIQKIVIFFNWTKKIL